MLTRLLHALVAASVVAGVAAGASYGVTHWVPEGATREAVERYVTAPGQQVYARLKDGKTARRLRHRYNVGSWTGIGFVICLVMTLLFGVKSIGAALALGFKVTLALVFLQGALILGGILVLSQAGG